jgi:multiple antibiotic resistance protein
MPNTILFTLTVFLGLFAMLEPFSHTVMFASVVMNLDPAAQKRIALKACLFTFVFVSLFVLLGELIFSLFDITLAAFQIGGGVILFFTGFNLIKGGAHEVEAGAQAGGIPSEDVAYSPIGTPMIAGPGVITAAINFTGLDNGFNIFNILVIIGCLAAMCLVNYFCFISSGRITRLLGPGAMGAVSRVMGILIIAIATQIVITGIRNAFHLS